MMENVYSHKPFLLAKAYETFVHGRKKFGNCLRCCKWSPDGTCLATNSEDHKIRIFNTPTFDWTQFDDGNFQPQLNLNCDLLFRESQIVYDFAWYPHMRSDEPTTCFLVTASKGVPLHIWDAYSGNIHLSFKAMNAVDELATPRCVDFMPCGSKLVAGYEKFLALFDLSRPGDGGEIIYDLPSGLVSCLTTNESLFALGTFNKMISLYDRQSNENIATIQAHKGGVTHLKLSPKGQHYLFSGARRDNEILCWDLRNYGNVLHTLKRDCFTNQRIYFDVNNSENILFTGNSSGMIKIFNFNSSEKSLDSVNEFRVSDCSTNGVSIHPTLPLLATTSGQRNLAEFDDDNEDMIFKKISKHHSDQSLKFWLFK